MASLSYSLDDKKVAQLKRLAEAEKRTVSQMTRIIVEEYLVRLENKNKPPRSSSKQ